ncbi:MAG: hypothetical protein AAB491_02430 [Patescibacteria group bacterium]
MPETDDLKKLLEKNLEVSKESLSILKKIQRARTIDMAFKLIKWIIIIGLSVGLYYYIEPYVRDYTGIFKSINSFIPK